MPNDRVSDMWLVLLILGLASSYCSTEETWIYPSVDESFWLEAPIDLTSKKYTTNEHHFNLRNAHIKYCRFRNAPMLYPPDSWRLLTGGFCYNYTQPDRFKPNQKFIMYNVNFKDPLDGEPYPILVSIRDEKVILFDYTSENHSNIIKSTFKEDRLFNKWVQCCEESVQCCNNFMNDDNLYPTLEHPCPAVWDAWSCFPQARANTTVYNLCPTHIYTPAEQVCPFYSEKYCKTTTWELNTNYNTCTQTPVYIQRHTFHIIVLSVASVLILPSLLIFFGFPKLRVLRVALHRNLLIAIFIRNLLTIISKNVVILDSLLPKSESNNVMADSSIGCKFLAFFENVSKNAIFTCMLIDAFYLHKLIVRIFAKDPKEFVLYVVTVVFSILPSLIWAGLMVERGMENCWMVDSETWFQWVTDGYKFFVLGLNILLLLDILRVLVLKLRKNITAQHTKATLRATLFMLPLFGVPQLFASQRNMVKIESCEDFNIYFYVTYTIDGVQGFLVALLFCYLNGEVHTEIKNIFRKAKTSVRSKFNKKPKAKRPGRRTTAMTNVFNSQFEPSSHIEFEQATEPSQFETSENQPSAPPLYSNSREDFPRSNNKNVEDWLTSNLEEMPYGDSLDPKSNNKY